MVTQVPRSGRSICGMISSDPELHVQIFCVSLSLPKLSFDLKNNRHQLLIINTTNCIVALTYDVRPSNMCRYELWRLHFVTKKNYSSRLL